MRNSRSNLSLLNPGTSAAISAIIAMRYIWSAIDSAPFIPWLTHPFLFVVYKSHMYGNKKPHYYPISVVKPLVYILNFSINIVAPFSSAWIINERKGMSQLPNPNLQIRDRYIDIGKLTSYQLQKMQQISSHYVHKPTESWFLHLCFVFCHRN